MLCQKWSQTWHKRKTCGCCANAVAVYYTDNAKTGTEGGLQAAGLKLLFRGQGQSQGT
jgi:hypothetical protein